MKPMNKPLRLLRSVLYVPGNNIRALQKARTLPVDAIIFDLEDAVGEGEKQNARQTVCRAVVERNYGERFLVIRINDLRTKTGEDDLNAALAACPDAVLLPKVESASDLLSLSSKIERFEGQGKVGDLKIWAMMETPLAVMHAGEIAKLATTTLPQLTTLVMGTNDLARQTGVAPGMMQPWLMNCVLAAKAYGLSIVDGVYNQFSDSAGFKQACQLGHSMGMDGKTLIHPRQIASCNEFFSPTKKEIDKASLIVSIFEKSEHVKANVIQIEGRMVERLHYEMAKKTLQIAMTIEEGKLSEI